MSLENYWVLDCKAESQWAFIEQVIFVSIAIRDQLGSRPELQLVELGQQQAQLRVLWRFL